MNKEAVKTPPIAIVICILLVGLWLHPGLPKVDGRIDQPYQLAFCVFLGVEEFHRSILLQLPFPEGIQFVPISVPIMRCYCRHQLNQARPRKAVVWKPLSLEIPYSDAAPIT